MTRDWLLGFPPVLLAQDDQMPCSDEGLHFPLGIPERAYHDYKSRPEYKRTRELMAFEMLPARPEITEADCRQVELQRVTYVGGTSQTGSIFVSTGPNEWVMFDGVKPSAYDEGTFTVASAPVGAEFATAGQSAYTTSVHHYTPLVTDEASPVPQPTPPGVWRKTAEHKPPKVGEYKTRMGEDDKPINGWSWDGERWFRGDFSSSATGKWQWLDTSGEFKVGDRVRVKDGVESICCKPGMVGTVKIVGRSVWFRADGEETDFCATDWLEHA